MEKSYNKAINLAYLIRQAFLKADKSTSLRRRCGAAGTRTRAVTSVDLSVSKRNAVCK